MENDEVESNWDEIEIFSSSQTAVTAFIGGPIAAGLVLAHNFRQFSRRFASSISILLGFSIGAAILLSVFLWQKQVENLFIVGTINSIVSSIVSGLIAQIFLDDDLPKLELPAKQVSWFLSGIVGFSCLVVEIFVFCALNVAFMLLLADQLSRPAGR